MCSEHVQVIDLDKVERERHGSTVMIRDQVREMVERLVWKTKYIKIHLSQRLQNFNITSLLNDIIHDFF